MSAEVLSFVPVTALKSGDVVTVNYAAGSASGDYAQSGHYALAFGGKLSITPAFGVSSFSFTWAGPTMPAGKPVRIQLERADRAAFPDAAPDQISAATYTLVVADKGRIKEFANACTLTLPATLPVGFSVLICQSGAGQVTFAAGAGAAMRQKDSLTNTAGQWAEVSARVRKNDGGNAAEWVLSGAMA